MTICPRCGQENRPEASFCDACGARLDAAVAPREERKVITVLFADLVGFTLRAEQLDPEDVRAVQDPYWQHLRAELERHGGTVEKFIGDAVVALFGAPVAHEDDPERAVRAALAIRDWARDQKRVQVRIAVTTGEALVRLGARPLAGEGMASGDVLNAASRLQGAAPTNGVLLDGTTYRATKSVIECAGAEPVAAKGKAEPLAVWEAVKPRSPFGVDVVSSTRTPLVGRERELDLLRDALVRVRQERSPQLVTLVGVPGIGKSRLVYELMHAAERDPELLYWRQGRCLPYGEGVTFVALAEMVKAQARILETDDAEVAAAKLREAVAGAVEGEADAAWVERQLRPLVGLSAVEGVGGDRRSEAFAAWRRFLEALAEQRLLVLVFEDLHWAGDALLDFVDHLVDWASGVPILVLATTRPELLERRPGWGGGKPNATTLTLAPLPDDDTARLLGSLLGRPVLEAADQVELLDRVGGNPLYAEQYVRMLSERAGGNELPLPESVQGLIAARLDGLSVEEKGLLQDAAVVGKVFWLGAVTALSGLESGRAEDLLHGLERKQFVQRVRRPSLAAETEYAFEHVLVCDVAYGQIPRAVRGEKHAMAAKWLTSLIGDRGDHVEMLANHYVRALELTRAAGSETIELERNARTALHAAGERALALNAFHAAVDSYGKALQLWPIDDPQRAKVLFAYGSALRWAEDEGADVLIEARDALIAAGDRESAAEAAVLLFDLVWQRDDPEPGFAHLTRAAELVGDLGPSRSKAYVLSSLARYYAFQEQEGEAIRLGHQALAIAEDLGLDDIQAHALNYIGTARVTSGDPAGLNDLERSIAITKAANSPLSLLAYNNLAGCLGALGQLRRAHELCAKGLQEARRFGIASWVELFEDELVVDDYLNGRWSECLRSLDSAITTRRGSKDTIWMHSRRAQIREARDDVQGALEDAAIALKLARSMSDTTTVPGEPLLLRSLASHARALLAVGRADEAQANADELTGLLATARPTLEWAGLLTELAAVLTALGQPSELLLALKRTQATPWVDAAYAYASGDFVRAADTCADIGALPDEAQARLHAAKALTQEGRSTEADDQLQRALTFFHSAGATRYIREAEALVAATV